MQVTELGKKGMIKNISMGKWSVQQKRGITPGVDIRKKPILNRDTRDL